jgi:hypothetical protein
MKKMSSIQDLEAIYSKCHGMRIQYLQDLYVQERKHEDRSCKTRGEY